MFKLWPAIVNRLCQAFDIVLRQLRH